jgi:methylase of polypeptide subunit release factors
MEEKYKRDNIRSFFPWKLHFWEVFNDNWGFDIVIGNPPYVSYWLRWVWKMDNTFKEYLKD